MRNTIFRQGPTTAGKRKSLSSAATELMSATSVPQPPVAFAELPSPLERQTMGGVVVSIQIGNQTSIQVRRCGHGCSEGDFPGAEIMLSNFTGADKVCIACGYTDLRKGIDGSAAMVQGAV